MEYFSDREQGPRPQTIDSITAGAWGGIVVFVQSLVSTGAFGQKYPEVCQDGEGPIGTDESAFILALKAEIPDIEWPLEMEPSAPDIMIALDLIQFCYQTVSKPIQGGYHSFFRHYHLSFDEESGKAEFREKINTIFQRNSIAFKIENDGSIHRLVPEPFTEAISTSFRTGDEVLDEMIDDAQNKFINPDPLIRKEAVERLWDCWERIKSLEIPHNKRESVNAIINKATVEPNSRVLLEEEARKLTDIGNTFQIRHSEVTQILITDNRMIDYLFYRLFSLIQLLLSKR